MDWFLYVECVSRLNFHVLRRRRLLTLKTIRGIDVYFNQRCFIFQNFGTLWRYFEVECICLAILLSKYASLSVTNIIFLFLILGHFHNIICLRSLDCIVTNAFFQGIKNSSMLCTGHVVKKKYAEKNAKYVRDGNILCSTLQFLQNRSRRNNNINIWLQCRATRSHRMIMNVAFYNNLEISWQKKTLDIRSSHTNHWIG